MPKPIIAFVCVLTACWLGMQACVVFSPQSVLGQEKKTKSTAKSKNKKPVNTTSLDAKAGDIQTAFIKDAEALASDYYEAGDYDKARVLLKSIQALKPDHPNLDVKLKLLDEESLASNETEIEVNAGHGWEAAGILVTEGKPLRIKAEGNYKFSISGQLGPAGIPAAKTPLDLVGDMPVGGLIGMVMNTDRTTEEKDKKKDRPFLIGEGCEYTPTRSGPLFLRINAPAENKNTGKIKVMVSGGVRKLK